jgi:transposase InsO family protein
MPWKVSSVIDERIRFVIAAEQGTRVMSRLCREFGVARSTGYRWWRRYRDGGCRIETVREHSRRPHRSPGRTNDEIVNRIVILRLIHGWGARKLCVLLKAEGMTVSESTINRVLKEHGLQYEPEVRGQATRRFVRSAPNELWQMDFKGPYRLTTGRCYPLSIIDDHSRYVVGLHALDNQLGASVHGCLVRTFERYGVPETMLVDHGIPWWSANGFGLTWLAVALIKQGIRLRFSGLRHPQTQGKVERFHRTLNDAMRSYRHLVCLPDWQRAFDRFVDEYNHLRPHESLAMAVPASHYQPATRAYHPDPPGWEYPAGAIVKRLNAKGLLLWKRRYYFVCEALANEWVEVNPCADTVLVRYRHMWIREIDIENSRSVTLIDKTQNPYV